MTAYRRELEHARRDACELVELLLAVDDGAVVGAELTERQLDAAICLAFTAQRALLRAITALHGGADQ